MELKKTTILSAFVVIAGLIAEIIFRDVLSRSIPGIIVSLVLAAIIFVSFYFTIEGVYFFWNSEREKESKHQKEFEQRLYNILNEQLKFQKVIYNEVHRLIQSGGVPAGETMSVPVGNTVMHQEAMISDADLEKIVSAVNDHTTRMTQGIENVVLDMGDRTTKAAQDLAGAVSEINHHTTEAVKDLETGLSGIAGTGSGDMTEAENIIAAIENLTLKHDQNMDQVTAILNEQGSEMKNVTGMLESQGEELGNVAEAVGSQGEELGNVAEAVGGQTTELGDVIRSIHDKDTEISDMLLMLQEQKQQMEQVSEAIGRQNDMAGALSEKLGEQERVIRETVSENSPVIQMPDFTELISEINNHTMSTAKVLAKYIGKTSGELGKKMDDEHKQLLNVVGG